MEREIFDSPRNNLRHLSICRVLKMSDFTKHVSIEYQNSRQQDREGTQFNLPSTHMSISVELPCANVLPPWSVLKLKTSEFIC